MSIRRGVVSIAKLEFIVEQRLVQKKNKLSVSTINLVAVSWYFQPRCNCSSEWVFI